MAWWAWLLVVVFGPSALIGVVLLPLLAVELVRSRPATNRRRRPAAQERTDGGSAATGS